MVDVALRYGINEAHQEKWAEVMRIKSSFDAKIGKPIYALLPGIAAGTFGTEELLQINQDDPEYEICRRRKELLREEASEDQGPNQNAAYDAGSHGVGSMRERRLSHTVLWRRLRPADVRSAA